ncbi:MAG: GMC family oxidoreductase [Alphaproteobacteria bacterium]|nr:GMC family oxidoreductase [Alphaproteobacteria bacterium]
MDCDYLIIGGGSAGAIVARRLADASQGTVILLEAGRSDEHDPAMLELSRLDEQTEETEWGFLARPQKGGPALLRYSRAKVLGGCGNHNDCAFLVPPESDFTAWEAFGAAGWGPEGVQPYFDRVESMVQVETDPPLSVTSAAFLRAGQELGLPRLQFRDQIAAGVGSFPLNVSGSTRQASSNCYLHPLSGLPPHLQVMTGTTAERLLFDGTKVTGCQTSRGAILARREVIMCAGSIQTPQLLMVSGVGPAAELRQHGISLVADAGGVGRHLLDHPDAPVIFSLASAVSAGELTLCEATMLLHLDKTEPAPEILCYFALRLREKYTTGDDICAAENAVKVTPNVARARSEGEVRLAGPDVRDHPVIDLNYFSDPEGYDLRTILAGFSFCRKLTGTAAFGGLGAVEVAPGPEVQSQDELADYVRRTCGTVYHPAGTCRMGREEDPGTVVIPNLKVKGLENIRICDASVFPAMVSVNLNNTVMMVAEKAADLIISKT